MNNPEYGLWLQNLEYRDQFALINLIAGLIAFGLLYKFGLIFNASPRRAYTDDRMLWLVVAGGLGLRLLKLDSNNLWYDESILALLVDRSPLDILTYCKNGVHPPGFHLIIWAWGNLPVGQPSDWWLRLPSAIIGTANIYMVYRLAKMFKRSDTESMVAAILMAVLPFQLFYSQEIRMYQLVQFGMILLIMGYLNYWKRQGLPQMVAGGVILLYSQNLSAALGLATLPFFHAIQYRFNLNHLVTRRLVQAYVLIGLLWLPWAVYGVGYYIANVAGQQSSVWIPYVSVGSVAYQMQQWVNGPVNSAWSISMAVSFFVITGGMVAGWRWGRDVLFLAGFPVLLAGLLSVVSPIFTARALIIIMPMLIILIAMFLSRARWPIVAVVVLVIAGHVLVYYSHDVKFDNKGWAGQIQPAPGETILFTSDVLAVWYYLPNRNVYMLRNKTNANGFHANNESIMALGAVLVDDEKDLPTGRAWVIHAENFTTDNETRLFYNQLTKINEIRIFDRPEGQLKIGIVELKP